MYTQTTTCTAQKSCTLSEFLAFVSFQNNYLKLVPRLACIVSYFYTFPIPLCLAPTPPRNLVVEVRSSTSILVKWQAPDKANGIIQRYVIKYGTAQDSLDERATAGRAWSTSHILANLEEFTTYYIQVQADTSVSGQSSIIVNAKTFEDGKK